MVPIMEPIQTLCTRTLTDLATPLMIGLFRRINLPHVVQFKPCWGKSRPRILLFKAKCFTVVNINSLNTDRPYQCFNCLYPEQRVKITNGKLVHLALGYRLLIRYTTYTIKFVNFTLGTPFQKDRGRCSAGAVLIELYGAATPINGFVLLLFTYRARSTFK